MGLLKPLSAATPGVAVAFVSRWIDLFGRTNLVYPGWQDLAEKTSLAIGAFAAIGICLAFQKVPQTIILILCGLCFVATFIGFYFCFSDWAALGKPLSHEAIMALRDDWYKWYVISMVLMISTLSFGSLAIEKSTPILFWIIASVAIIIVLAGVVFIFLH
jgi:hypothetical protein